METNLYRQLCCVKATILIFTPVIIIFLKVYCLLFFRFLYHFSASTVGNVPFEEKYLSLLLNRDDDVVNSSGTFEVLSSEPDQVKCQLTMVAKKSCNL